MSEPTPTGYNYTGVLTQIATALGTLVASVNALSEEQKKTREALEAYNQIVTDRDRGVYMTPNLKADRHGANESALQQAAFDVAMENSGNVKQLREKLVNPTQW